jgi:ribokinase
LLQFDDVSAEVFVGHDLVCVASPSNRSADCFPNIVAEGTKAGAFVSFNPAIRQLTSRPGDFLACLDKVDLLAINRVEAEALIPTISTHHEPCGADESPLDDNTRHLMKVGLEFGGFSMSLKRFFGAIRSLGTSNVIVTDGINRSYLANETGIYFCPILRGEVRGTAGAGDAFISPLSAFLTMPCAAKLALRAVTINASAVVAEIDTQIGLMKLDALEQAIDDHAADLPVSILA